MPRWYERAQVRVWKKHGVPIDTSAALKRDALSRGLLGYKVLIDGFNNTFDASNASNCSAVSDKRSQTNEADRYIGYTNEERERILKMKAYMKKFVADTKQWGKSTPANIRQKSRHPPLLAQHGLLGAKMQTVNLALTKPSTLMEDLGSSSQLSCSQVLSSSTDPDQQRSKLVVDCDSSLNIDTAASIITNSTAIESNASKFSTANRCIAEPK